MSHYKFDDIKKLSSLKLQEFLSKGYQLALDGDGSFGNCLTFRLEKDGDRFEFAVKEETIAYDIHEYVKAYIIGLTKVEGRCDFPSKNPEDVLFSQHFYVLSEGPSRMLHDYYFTNNIEEVIAVEELRWKRAQGRYIPTTKLINRIPSKRLMELINEVKGFKRADAYEMEVIRHPYGYFVKYHHQDNGLEFKFPKKQIRRR